MLVRSNEKISDISTENRKQLVTHLVNFTHSQDLEAMLRLHLFSRIEYYNKYIE